MAYAITRKAFLTAMAGVVLGQAAAAETPADFPTRPIKLVVGMAPGGSTDILARTLGQKLSVSLGQTVVVENRPGAAGTIGGRSVVAASPDGYTLLLASLSNGVISPLMFRVAPYDPVKDFAAVSQVTSLPLVLVVTSSSPVKSVRDLIALAKSKPSELNFLSGGTGTATGMAGELFASMAGLKLQHVPYNGDAPAVAALLARFGDFMLPAIPAALPYIKSGQLRPLAVTTLQRIPTLPDVPTMNEAGVPGYSVNVWNGLLAPAKTPRPIVDKLNQAVIQALNDPAVAALLASMAFEPVGGTQEEFGAVIRDDMARWPKVIKQSGATAE